MSGAVPYSEALAILRWMVSDPGQVRVVRAFADARFGPVPFFVGADEAEAEVTITFEGEGVMAGLASVRIGARFSNCFDWDEAEDGNPFDDLSRAEIDVLELALRGAESVRWRLTRVRPGPTLSA